MSQPSISGLLALVYPPLMAVRRTLLRWSFDDRGGAKLPEAAFYHSPRLVQSPPNGIPPNAARSNFHRVYINSPDIAARGYFRRLFGHRVLYQSPTRVPEFASPQATDMLKETLRGINITRNRIRLDGLDPLVSQSPAFDSLYGISIEDTTKILKLYHLENLKRKLRDLQKNSISYSDFTKICIQTCENDDQGNEFARMLDETGSVIILGNIVFLRPEQVARSISALLSESTSSPEKMEEVKKMKKEEERIEDKAKVLVRGELYCGLGFLIIQTAAFMRLTFWELSWDVMEPICFFVTSIYVALRYGFFLKTSTEPSFNGYFQSRVVARKKKLMAVRKFDIDKYNRLKKACFPCG